MKEIRLTDNFLNNFASIKRYYSVKNQISFFDQLLEQFEKKIIPHIRSFPNSGRTIKENSNKNIENQIRYKNQLNSFKAEWRETLFNHFSVIYFVTDKNIWFVSIKDQRQQEYNFSEFFD
jgi:hypothetical protein